MPVFGTIPPEPPRQSSLAVVAPAFRVKVERVCAALMAKGYDPLVFETLRTKERSDWLYGFGRDYDDGRGVVTHIAPDQHSWHFYGLAADIISASRGWNAADAFWTDLPLAAEAEGLASGARWASQDKPHVQWWVEGMHTSPSEHAEALYSVGGLEAVWRAVQADQVPVGVDFSVLTRTFTVGGGGA